MTRKLSLVDIFTTAQLQQLQQTFQQHRGTSAVHGELRRSIEPWLAEINQRLEQENDVDFLAYAVEYILEAAT